jgi:hypothetical protein
MGDKGLGPKMDSRALLRVESLLERIDSARCGASWYGRNT